MERNRAQGWKHAKLSGHKNEDLITQLVLNDKDIQQKLLTFANKQGSIVGVAEGGLCETSIPSVLNDTTKAKPDIRLLLDNNRYLNISIKKSRGGQVFLITVDRFIDGFEKQYNKTIPNDVKRAIQLFWGSAQDCSQILKNYAKVEIPYQTKRHRLVKDTLDRYNPQLSTALVKWFQDNITDLFDFCFVRGLALNSQDWADVIWYKNLLTEEDDPDTLFRLDQIKHKIQNNKHLVQFGTRTGGSTIQLPFGFVQWHLNQIQFHHSFNQLSSL